MAGLFVAVGHDGLRITSQNGTDWAPAQIGKEGETYQSVAAGNGVFLAIGRFGYDHLWAVSSDGSTWQSTKRDSKGNRHLLGVGFGKETFVVVGGQAEILMKDAASVYLTKDGVALDEVPSIGGITVLRRVIFGNGRFVGVGDRGRRSWSDDGRTWHTAEKPRARDTMVELAYGAGRFVGVGLHGLRMSSADGETWSVPLIGEEGEHLNAIVWAGDRFVAVGAGVTYLASDGVTWERRTNQDAPLTTAFGDGRFVGTNWRGRIMVSEDGIQWRQVHKAEQHLEAVTFRSA
jgi:hypothetical protein